MRLIITASNASKVNLSIEQILQRLSDPASY
jgi:hypothetical protein